MKTNNIINQCKQEFKKVYPDVEIPPITSNNRLKLCGGRVLFTRKNKQIEVNKIELNTKLLNTAERLKSTLMHELAHVAELALFGNGGHGRTWQRCMNDLGLTPNKYHDYDLSILNGYHKAYCDCKTRTVSTRKKNRMLRGEITLRCNSCKEKVDFNVDRLKKID